MSASLPVLGIIAGEGALPLSIAESCRRSGRACFVLALEGADMNALSAFPHASVRIGAVGEAIEYLKSAQVRELVMAGGIKRPSMSALKPDAVGARLIARLGLRLFSGDDALLKGLIAEGTDALIARCAGLCREKKRAVLVKAKKPGQESRADLPTLGPRTIQAIEKAEMLGVAFEAGGCLLLEMAEVVRLADLHGLFVIGVAPG
jgi:DUF1009 family protein